MRSSYKNLIIAFGSLHSIQTERGSSNAVSTPGTRGCPPRPSTASRVLCFRPEPSTTQGEAQAAARLDVYVARERAGLIEDFKRQSPDVVLIDNEDSDWGNWAYADPELSVLLKSYVRVQTIKGIEILRRAN